jgi:hypothetical protein
VQEKDSKIKSYLGVRLLDLLRDCILGVPEALEEYERRFKTPYKRRG